MAVHPLNVGRGAASRLYHARLRFGADVRLDDLSDAEMALVDADRVHATEIMRRKGLRTSLLRKIDRLRAEMEETQQRADALLAPPQKN